MHPIFPLKSSDQNGSFVATSGHRLAELELNPEQLESHLASFTVTHSGVSRVGLAIAQTKPSSLHLCYM